MLFFAFNPTQITFTQSRFLVSQPNLSQTIAYSCLPKQRIGMFFA